MGGMQHLRTVETGVRPYASYVPQRASGNPTLAELAALHLQALEATDSPSLREVRCVISKHLLPVLGPETVAELDVDQATGWWRWLKVESGLSASRLETILWVVRSMVDLAVPDAIPTNPFRSIDPRELRFEDRGEQLDRGLHVLSFDEASRFVSSHLLPLERRACWAVPIAAGVRAAELVALRWGAWDRRVEPLTRLIVREQWKKRARDKDGRRGRFRARKNHAPTLVPVAPFLEQLLTEWRLEWPHRFGHEPRPQDLIFPRERRGHLVPIDPDKLLKRYREDLLTTAIIGSLDERRDLHGLRHTFVTLTTAAGADEEVILSCTHRRKKSKRRSVSEIYRHTFWLELCEAVALHPVRLIRPLEQRMFPLAIDSRSPAPAVPCEPSSETEPRRRRRRMKQLELLKDSPHEAHRRGAQRGA